MELDLGFGFEGAIVKRPARHAKSLARSADEALMPFFFESLVDRLDQFSSASSWDGHFCRVLRSSIASP